MKIKFLSKFKASLFSFSFFRFLHSIYNSYFFYLKYSIYLLLITLIGFTYLLVFDQEKLKSATYYIANYSFTKTTPKNSIFNGQVNIHGSVLSDLKKIQEVVRSEMINENNQNLDYTALIDAVKEEINQLPWVKDVLISVTLPSNISITITEYLPFAIWQNKEKNYIIDKDGKVITDQNIDKFYYLLILTGKNANYNAKSLFNILVTDSKISRDIYSAAWVGDRRWDIIFNNDLLVKLPENNLKHAWSKLVKIYNTPGALINLKLIDLRIDDKIYLGYLNSTIKELKSW